MSAPLRDRFGVLSRLEYYNETQLTDIVIRTAEVLATEIDELAAVEIARRSRGTPRIANRLLRRVRDFAQVRGNGVVDEQLAKEALELLQVDRLGLDHIDHKLLRGIIEKFRGGPVGLETIAATIGEESHTIEDVYEPYLLQIGFLQRTPRGRIVTDLVYRHFQMEVLSIGTPRSDYLQYANRILPFLHWSFQDLAKYKELAIYMNEKGFIYALAFPTDLFREWNRAIREQTYLQPAKIQQLLEITVQLYFKCRNGCWRWNCTCLSSWGRNNRHGIYSVSPYSSLYRGESGWISF